MKPIYKGKSRIFLKMSVIPKNTRKVYQNFGCFIASMKSVYNSVEFKVEFLKVDANAVDET